MATIQINEFELLQAKRAIVVLAEVMKMVDQLSGKKKAPLELREDMAALIGLLKKIEPIADGRLIALSAESGLAGA